MKNYIFILFILFFQSSFSQLLQMSKFEQEFMRKYDPQTYSYYQFGKGITNQGKQIAANLSNQLDKYQTLISSDDPVAILDDFEAKMADIQNLQDSYIEQANRFAFNAGRQIGKSLKNKNYAETIAGIIGFADQMSAQKAAKQKLEEQKRRLEEQKRKKLSEIYWKKQRFRQAKRKEYLNRAAYASNEKEEQYNLAFANYVVCGSNCKKPTKPLNTDIENTFIDKDVQLRGIANRKYSFYRKTGYQEFRKAAISFAAAAANEKGTAENFFLMGKYYLSENPILGLSTLLTAQGLDQNFNKNELNALIKKGTKETEREIEGALKNNDVKYLSAFLNAGLDKIIKIQGQSILVTAITLDQPDAVQTILNTYLKGLSSKEKNQRLKKTILMAALKNAPNTLNRFKKLGLSLNFTLNEFNAVDLAAKGLAPDAMIYLIKDESFATLYKEKYKDHPVRSLVLAKTDVIKAAAQIDKLDEENLMTIASKIFQLVDQDPVYYELFYRSPRLNAISKSSDDLVEELNERFYQQVTLPSPLSKAHLIYKSGLVDLKNIEISDKKKNYIENRKIQVEKILNKTQIYEGTTEKSKGDPLVDYSVLNIDFYHNSLIANWSIPEKMIFENFKQAPNVEEDLKNYAFWNRYATLRDGLAYEKEHLAFAALVFHNYELFGEIAKREDLSQVRLSNGQNLFDLMKKRKKDGTKKKYADPDLRMKLRLADYAHREHYRYLERKEFLAKGLIDLTKEEDRNILINEFLEYINFYRGPKYGEERKEAKWLYELKVKDSNKNSQIYYLIKYFFDIQQLDYDAKISKSGGTFLHWIVDWTLRMSESNGSGSISDKEIFIIESVFKLPIDRSIVDYNGLNVTDYVLKNKSALKKIKSIYYDTKYQNLNKIKTTEYSSKYKNSFNFFEELLDL